MRLTTIILIASLMQVSAATFAQLVTLNKKNVQLETVLKEIRQQTGYDFYYDGQLTKGQKIDISVNQVTLDQALKAAFKNLPLSYTIDGQIVSITKKAVTLIDNVKIAVAPIDVTGRVTDENNQPLAGATIQVKGLSISTNTDANGFFTLKQVQSDATVIITFIGYDKTEVKVQPNIGQLKLHTATSPLDEVKVIAYGKTSQRLATGNTFTVKASEIEKQPVNNPILALEGKVPGLSVIQSTGLSGSGVSIKIQGQSSMSTSIGTDPLIIVDGVPYPSQLLYSLNPIQGSSGNAPGLGRTTTGSGSSLAFINPSDIESISVLKDADATAIYGSRAGNGAILITTKKGSVGQTKVQFNLQSGIGKVGHFMNLMNKDQYLSMRKEALKNDGASPSTTDYDLNGTWAATNDNDWQKNLLGGSSQYTDLQSNVSGGNTNTQFYLGTGYHRESSVFSEKLNDTKGAFHFNLNHSSTNRKFSLQFSNNYLFDSNKLNNTDLTYYAITLPPVAPPLYNTDGTINWAQLANGNATWVNPIALLDNQYDIKTTNLISNIIASYHFTSNLEFKTSFGYNVLQSDQFTSSPFSAIRPNRRATASRSSTFSHNNTTSWSIEPQLLYNLNIKKLKIDALVGASLLNTNNGIQIQSGSGYTSDVFLNNISLAATKSATAYTSQYKYNALFARISTNWGDTYLANISLRRDGSSRFGGQNSFHNFGSVGLGWVFSNEDFLKDTPLISFGKLRMSYGITGNDQIGDYKYLNLYNSINGVPVAYQGAPSLIPAGLPNEYLQWEETKKLQFGVDLGFSHDRIILSANYYRNRSSNQLLDYGLPIVTGFNSLTQNLPATIQNTGLEMTANAIVIKKTNFYWSSSLNLTIPRNKLLKFDGIETTSYASSYLVGQPVTIVKAYQSLGVDPTSGVFNFRAANGASTSNPTPIDLTQIINPVPTFFAGLQNSFSYQSLSVDFSLQYVKQVGKIGYPILSRAGQLISDGTGNQPEFALDRWRNPGDTKQMQRYYAVSNGNYSNAGTLYGNSDAVYNDASFLRLKNVSISWQLPIKYIEKINAQGVKIYLQGQNLLTFTKFKGLDPESQSITTLPPLKVLTFGIQASF